MIVQLSAPPHSPRPDAAAAVAPMRVERPPLRLLEEEVRVPAHPKSPVVTNPGSRRPPAASLALWKSHCCWSATNSPTRNAGEEDREGGIPPVQGRGILPGDEGGQGDQHEQRVLVQHDEEEVEDLELPRLHPTAQDRPAVVLHAGVAALAGEVEGQPRGPGGHQQCHQDESGGVAAVHDAGDGEDPDVDRRDDRPDAVDPRRVLRDRARRSSRTAQVERRDDEDEERADPCDQDTRGFGTRSRMCGLTTWYCGQTTWRAGPHGGRTDATAPAARAWRLVLERIESRPARRHGSPRATACRRSGSSPCASASAAPACVRRCACSR